MKNLSNAHRSALPIADGWGRAQSWGPQDPSHSGEMEAIRGSDPRMDSSEAIDSRDSLPSCLNGSADGNAKAGPSNNKTTPGIDDVHRNGNGEGHNEKDINERERYAARRIEQRKPKGKARGVRIATLNMNGRLDKKKESKWPRMVTLMRKNRIAVLALQETHITDDNVESLRLQNPKVEIYYSGDKTNAEGVAFVINKDILKYKECELTILLPGRVVRLELKLANDTKMDILNVYGPNGAGQQENFYRTLREVMTGQNLSRDLIIVGDFNLTLNEIDRAPPRKDNDHACKVLESILQQYRMIDGWRRNNKEQLDFTYYQKATNSMSRIDRIYMSKEKEKLAYGWEIVDAACISDHEMVTVELMEGDEPYQGKGMWRMDRDTMLDPKFKTKINTLLIGCQNELKKMKDNNTPGRVGLWMTTKKEIKKLTIEHTKERAEKLKRKRKEMERKVNTLLNKLQEQEKGKSTEAIRAELVAAKEQQREYSQKNIDALRQQAKVNYLMMGEQCTKYWFALNKEKHEPQIVHGLMDKNNNIKRKTTEMVKIATEYHTALQAAPGIDHARRLAIEKVTGKITRMMTEEACETLEEDIGEKEIEKAIMGAANGSSPGADGIPYEFYKELVKDKRDDKDNLLPDIVAILFLVFDGIEADGMPENQPDTVGANGRIVEEGTNFTDATMFLLYKKKDRTKVENYRPLTLLNTDYKTYTKVLSNRLGVIAPLLIHEDQAGFVPGRSLYNHTRTSHLVIEYCDLTNTNGCIVALDQEKAYDKIDHEYLWEVLRGMKIPERFIKRVSELYKNVTKRVIVNGAKGAQFPVKRGVHQGDPMSCLLYDLAIEPLAEMIRQSELRGIPLGLPNNEKLLVNLFADDTLAYLGCDDKLETLEEIIELFCTASTAKFNLEKTEYLPVGNERWRIETAESRVICGKVVDENTRVVREGQPMRTLGAWVGNNINIDEQWKNIKEKQKKILDIWGACHLSYRGKELVLKALVQSRAVFLATVNGITNKDRDEMTSMYKGFLWDGKDRGLMKWETVVQPRNKGGLGIPDLKARIQAIELMWVKKWLNPDKRPVWAIVMDKILENDISMTMNYEKEGRNSWVMQSWHEKTGAGARTSKMVRRMTETARRWNLDFVPLHIGSDTKREIPLWYNGMMIDSNRTWNKASARCLRHLHQVKTVGDLVDEAMNEDRPGVCDKKACGKMAELLVQRLPPVINPLVTTPKKNRVPTLIMTPNTREENRTRTSEVVADVDIKESGHPEAGLRILKNTPGAKTKKREQRVWYPTYREARRSRGEVVAWTEVASRLTGYENGTGAIAFKCTGSWEDIDMLKINGDNNWERLQILAAVEVMNRAPEDMGLHIYTKCKKMIEVMSGGARHQEDTDWTHEPYAAEWEGLVTRTRKRTSVTKVSLIDKTDNVVVMKDLRRKAKQSLENEEEAIINIGPKKEWRRKGARLQALDQKTAYKMIMAKLDNDTLTQSTEEALVRIQDEIEEKTNKRPYQTKIWVGICKLRTPKIGDFIWKIIHNRIKCGPWFRYIPGWEDKQYCACGAQETVEHIIFECEINRCTEMWEWVGEMWDSMGIGRFLPMNIRLLKGIAALEVDKEDTSNDLYRTMTTTMAWVIWKERNNRIFNEEDNSPSRMKSKWKGIIRDQVMKDVEILQKCTNKKSKEKTEKRLMKTWGVNNAFLEKRGDKFELGIWIDYEREVEVEEEERQINRHDPRIQQDRTAEG